MCVYVCVHVCAHALGKHLEEFVVVVFFFPYDYIIYPITFLPLILPMSPLKFLSSFFLLLLHIGIYFVYMCIHM